MVMRTFASSAPSSFTGWFWFSLSFWSGDGCWLGLLCSRSDIERHWPNVPPPTRFFEGHHRWCTRVPSSLCQLVSELWGRSFLGAYRFFQDYNSFHPSFVAPKCYEERSWAIEAAEVSIDWLRGFFVADIVGLGRVWLEVSKTRCLCGDWVFVAELCGEDFEAKRVRAREQEHLLPISNRGI